MYSILLACTCLFFFFPFFLSFFSVVAELSTVLSFCNLTDRLSPQSATAVGASRVPVACSPLCWVAMVGGYCVSCSCARARERGAEHTDDVTAAAVSLPQQSVVVTTAKLEYF